jgi:hypothetical protein
MPRYEIKHMNGLTELWRDGEFLEVLWNLSTDEITAILRVLNGPSEAKAKRVAELRQLAVEWRRHAPMSVQNNTVPTCELIARDFDSQADLLEKT